MKYGLIDEIKSGLDAGGYTVADCTGTQSCFDVLARKGDKTFIVKALANIEGLSPSCAHDMRRIAHLLSASPLVVGERMKSCGLSRGVVYERHGIPVLSSGTFTDFVNDSTPRVYSVRGNYCVKLDPEKLKRLRLRVGLTQEELAEKLGVSKQSIYRYEASGRISADLVGRLERILGAECRSTQAGLPPSHADDGADVGDDFSRHLSSLKREVASAFQGIGFRTSITNAPFDILVSDRESIYTAVSDDWRRLERKIEIIDQVSDIMGGYSVCITQRRIKHHSNVMKPEELAEIKSVREFLRRLSEM